MDADPTAIVDQPLQHSHLLFLPPEILQLILTYCTTPTFIHFTRSCRHLFDLASESRDVVLHHLDQIPGIKVGLDDRTATRTSELWTTLRRRAALNLYGVNLVHDRTDIIPVHSIDTKASCLSEDSLRFRIVIATQDSETGTHVIKLYDRQCIKQGEIHLPWYNGIQKVCKVVRWGIWLSGLYSETEPEPGYENTMPVTGREHEATGSPGARFELPHFNAISPTRAHDPSSSFVSEARKDLSRTKYYLFHQNVYNFTTGPTCASIPHSKAQDHLVPVDLALSSRLQCAILWDRVGAITATPSANIIMYYTDFIPSVQDPLDEVVACDAQSVWSISTSDDSDASSDVSLHEAGYESQASVFPRGVRFFASGARLALYASGQTVPFECILNPVDFDGLGNERRRQRGSGDSRQRRADVMVSNTVSQGLDGGTATNASPRERVRWVIERPFWGRHETFTVKVKVDEASGGSDADGEEGVKVECEERYLCLATTVVEGVKICGILRCSVRRDSEDCRHEIDMDGMPHVTQTTQVVARLWGWAEPLSSDVGIVGWSADGRRLAVAGWGRVYVWVVEPTELAEVHADEDEGDETSESGNDGTSDEGGRSEEDEGNHDGTGYYERVWDNSLQTWVVELKPIVLKVPDGQVVKEVAWGINTVKGESFDWDTQSLQSRLTMEGRYSTPEEMEMESNNSVPGVEPGAGCGRGGDSDSVKEVERESSNILAGSDEASLGSSEGLLFRDVEDLHELIERESSDEMTARRREKEWASKSGRLADELMVLTDRGISVFDLGVWAMGRREVRRIEE